MLNPKALVRKSEESIHYSEKVATFVVTTGPGASSATSIRLSYQPDKFF